jgi:hypothetical protein
VVAAIRALEDSEKVVLPDRRESKWKRAARIEGVRGSL